jgi:superfamily II DNA or RNA helicase
LVHTATTRIYYDKGTICVDSKCLNHIPSAIFDERNKVLRAEAVHYKEIIEYLKSSDIDFVDLVPDLIPTSFIKVHGLELRDYQKKALGNWIAANMRGCIVLPTGSGKTAIAIKAIEKANTSTLVVVPTIDLMEQWTTTLKNYLVGLNDDVKATTTDTISSTINKTVKIGRLGGGEDDIQSITVSTYDSSYLKAPIIGNKFGLVIFDEVHHLPSPGYRYIAEQIFSPYRLGLTATIEREDDLHSLIPRLVGGIVFEMGSKILSEKKHLANYTIERIQVDLLPDEQREYQINQKKFLANLRRLGFMVPSFHNIKKLIMMSNQNPVAREAILARNKANEIALNSKAKIIELTNILEKNSTGKDKKTRTIIFTQHNKMVYDISNRFLIPCITHKSTNQERDDLLDGFRSGRYHAIVTSKVLDEGIDVPDAELGIILSGTGSGREFIQRLGRLLRPKQDVKKEARLIEIISKATGEVNTSAKRTTALKKASSVKNDHDTVEKSNYDIYCDDEETGEERSSGGTSDKF